MERDCVGGVRRVTQGGSTCTCRHQFRTYFMFMLTFLPYKNNGRSRSATNRCCFRAPTAAHEFPGNSCAKRKADPGWRRRLSARATAVLSFGKSDRADYHTLYFQENEGGANRVCCGGDEIKMHQAVYARQPYAAAAPLAFASGRSNFVV